MWTIQQVQAGVVYVALTGLTGAIVVVVREGLRSLRRIRASFAIRTLAVWGGLTVWSLCYLLAQWILVARVYR